jgi:lysophospholipase L1-like esterase
MMNKIVLKSRLATLIFGSLIFISACTTQKTQVQVANKYESEMAAFDKLNQAEKYSDQSILFVGSSSIRLWNTIKDEMAPYPVIQRGFGGSRTPDVVQNMKRIAYPLQFKAVVIFVGNDITGSPNDLSPTETMLNFKEMVKILHSKYRKLPVFIVEITPCQSRWKQWPQIKQTNAMLKEYCQKGKNLVFIETAKSYLNGKGEPNNDLFRDDCLHLNHQGYLIWGKLIKGRIDQRLEKKEKG